MVTGREPWFAAPLPMPSWLAKVGAVKVIYHADTGGNDAYESECEYHHTRSGPRFWTAEQAGRWRCPRCVRTVREHEIATRDD